MYVAAADVDTTTLFQGDVIKDFPFYILEKSQPIRRNEAGLFEQDGDLESEHSLHAVESNKQSVMILSQSCDLQRRKNIVVCPVYGLDQFIIDNTINADSARSIRDRKNNYLFYLPAFADLPESIADLQTMLYVPRAFLINYLPQRMTSLSDLGRHHLGWTLASFFGRPVEK